MRVTTVRTLVISLETAYYRRGGPDCHRKPELRNPVSLRRRNWRSQALSLPTPTLRWGRHSVMPETPRERVIDPVSVGVGGGVR